MQFAGAFEARISVCNVPASTGHLQVGEILRHVHSDRLRALGH